MPGIRPDHLQQLARLLLHVDARRAIIGRPRAARTVDQEPPNGPSRSPCGDPFLPRPRKRSALRAPTAALSSGVTSAWSVRPGPVPPAASNITRGKGHVMDDQSQEERLLELRETGEAVGRLAEDPAAFRAAV